VTLKKKKWEVLSIREFGGRSCDTCNVFLIPLFFIGRDLESSSVIRVFMLGDAMRYLYRFYNSFVFYRA
jgi:hypothetical protein